MACQAYGEGDTFGSGRVADAAAPLWALGFPRTLARAITRPGRGGRPLLPGGARTPRCHRRGRRLRVVLRRLPPNAVFSRALRHRGPRTFVRSRTGRRQRKTRGRSGARLCLATRAQRGQLQSCSQGSGRPGGCLLRPTRAPLPPALRSMATQARAARLFSEPGQPTSSAAGRTLASALPYPSPTGHRLTAAREPEASAHTSFFSRKPA